MTIESAAELALSLLDDIRWYWNFYVTVILAILGWFIKEGGIAGRYAKVLLTLAFLAFAGMNLLGLATTGEALTAVSHEISAQARETPPASAQFTAFVASLPERATAPGWLGAPLPWLIHVPIDIGILVLIWTAKRRDATATGGAKAKP